MYQKKKGLRTTFIISGVLCVLVGIQGIIMYETMSKYKSKIYPKVYIENINVGGKTKEEAKTAIIQKHNNFIAEKNIIIKLSDKQYTIETSKLDIKYDDTEVINKAYDIGRKRNLFENYVNILFPVEKKFQLNHIYNYGVVDTVLKDIVKENSKSNSCLRASR